MQCVTRCSWLHSIGSLQQSSGLLVKTLLCASRLPRLVHWQMDMIHTIQFASKVYWNLKSFTILLRAIYGYLPRSTPVLQSIAVFNKQKKHVRQSDRFESAGGLRLGRKREIDGNWVIPIGYHQSIASGSQPIQPANIDSVSDKVQIFFRAFRLLRFCGKELKTSRLIAG